MTYTLLVFLFVGILLFHGYRKGKQNRKKSNESWDMCLSKMEENISQCKLVLPVHTSDENTELDFSRAVKMIKISDSIRL